MMPLRQSSGNWPVFQAALNMLVSQATPAGPDDFIISAEMLQTPGALPFFSDLMATMWSSITGNRRGGALIFARRRADALLSAAASASLQSAARRRGADLWF